jgi:hypothetical protein
VSSVYIPQPLSQAPPPDDEVLAGEFLLDILDRALDAIDRDRSWRLGRHSPQSPGQALGKYAVQQLVRLQQSINRGAAQAASRSNLAGKDH